MKLNLKCPNCDRTELNYETETRTQCGRELISCMYLWCENGDFGTDYHSSPKLMMEELFSAYEFRKKAGEASDYGCDDIRYLEIDSMIIIDKRDKGYYDWKGGDS